MEATGSDVPNGIEDFSQVKLCEIMSKNIEMARYTKPTPVQVYLLNFFDFGLWALYIIVFILEKCATHYFG